MLAVRWLANSMNKSADKQVFDYHSSVRIDVSINMRNVNNFNIKTTYSEIGHNY